MEGRNNGRKTKECTKYKTGRKRGTYEKDGEWRKSEEQEQCKAERRKTRRSKERRKYEAADKKRAG